MTSNPRIRRIVAACNGIAPDATDDGVVVAVRPRGNWGRDKLKRHREEVAGRVSIPDTWGQEGFLMDWTGYKAFDALLSPGGINLARQALVAEGRLAWPGMRRLLRG